MGVGTSLGAYFDDDFHFQQNQWNPKKFPSSDENVVAPDTMQKNKIINSDPKNIIDDSGSIVGYGTDNFRIDPQGHLDLNLDIKSPEEFNEIDAQAK